MLSMKHFLLSIQLDAHCRILILSKHFMMMYTISRLSSIRSPPNNIKSIPPNVSNTMIHL